MSLKEEFRFTAQRHQGLARWPSEEQLPGFREFAAHFHKVEASSVVVGTFAHDGQDCYELVDNLLRCISTALNLRPEESLSKHHTSSASVANLIHYPATSVELLQSGETVRGAAHSDRGTLTLLFQHDIGGLEVADMSSTDKVLTKNVETSATFVSTDPRAGVLVLPGYLLRMWTNGRYHSTVHRVMRPPSSKTDGHMREVEDIPERYSIAFFSYPDPETIVEPLPTCRSEERPRRFASVNGGQYLLQGRVDSTSSVLS